MLRLRRPAVGHNAIPDVFGPCHHSGSCIATLVKRAHAALIKHRQHAPRQRLIEAIGEVVVVYVSHFVLNVEGGFEGGECASRDVKARQKWAIHPNRPELLTVLLVRRDGDGATCEVLLEVGDAALAETPPVRAARGFRRRLALGRIAEGVQVVQLPIIHVLHHDLTGHRRMVSEHGIVTPRLGRHPERARLTKVVFVGPVEQLGVWGRLQPRIVGVGIVGSVDEHDAVVATFDGIVDAGVGPDEVAPERRCQCAGILPVQIRTGLVGAFVGVDDERFHRPPPGHVSSNAPRSVFHRSPSLRARHSPCATSLDAGHRANAR